MDNERKRYAKPSLYVRVAQVALVLLAIPVMYVLSIGPARYLHGRSSPSTQRAIEAIYLPLSILPDKSRPGRWLAAYADLWD